MGKTNRLKAERERMNRLNKMIRNGYEIDGRGRLVHRTICRQAHGPFPHTWIVHHIDENKGNNSPDNLIAMPVQVHGKLHTAQRKNKMTFGRSTIEQMIKCYVNLGKRTEVNFIIKVEAPHAIADVGRVIAPLEVKKVS